MSGYYCDLKTSFASASKGTLVDRLSKQTLLHYSNIYAAKPSRRIREASMSLVAPTMKATHLLCTLHTRRYLEVCTKTRPHMQREHRFNKK